MGESLSAKVSGGETMRALLAAACGIVLLAACNTTDAPPPSKDVKATSAPANANANASQTQDLLASCRKTENNGAVTWKCPHDVGVIDIRSKAHDDPNEVTKNLNLFAQPMVGDAGKRDDGDLVIDGKRYRSVKISGDVAGKGPIFARMVVVDSDPTRYVSCGAKTDACDDWIRATLAHDSGGHDSPGPKASAP
jgi:hypothetical protein